MRKLMLAAVLLAVRTAHADQCAMTSQDQAQAAAKLLTNTAVILWCGPCGDARPARQSNLVAHKVTAHDGRVNLEGKDVDLAYVYAQTGPKTFTNVGLMVGCGARDVEPFVDFGAAAVVDLSALTKELDEVNRKVTRATDDVAKAQSQGERDVARAKLDALRKEKLDLEQRISAENAAAAKRARAQGVHISEKCRQNPLAKGC